MPPLRGSRGGRVPGGRPVGRAFGAAVLVAVLVGLLLLVVLSGLAGSAALRQHVGDTVSAPLALLAALALSWTAFRSTGRTRRAWALLAVGTWCSAVAETIWWLDRLVTDPSVLVGLDDVFYLAGTPFLVVGAASFPVPSWRGADRLRAVLDGLVVGGGLLFAVGSFGLFHPGAGALRDQVVAVAYPAGDVAVLFVALVVALQAPRRAALPLGLVVAALATYAVGDVLYCVQAAQGTYVSGTPVDLTWNYAYLLLGLAGLAPQPAPRPRLSLHLRPEDAAPASTAYRGRVLPWVFVGTALAGVATAVLLRPSLLVDPALVVVAAVMALVFAARQAWFVADLARLNARLARQATRVERMADAVVDAILVVDRGGRVRYANDTAVLLLGRPRPLLVGLPITDLVRRDGQGRSGVLEALGSTRSVVQAADTFLRPDGSPIEVDVSIGPIDHHQPEGMVLVFRDVSAQRELERLKNEFTSVISHEVRTPLTSIRGALTLLDGGVSGELPPEASRMVRIAMQSSERLSRLINDVLDAERLESGYIRLEPRPEPVTSLVERAIFEMGGQAASTGVEVVADPTSGTVEADGDRIVQVLTNLIGNALKFSPAGSTVRVGAAPVGETVELWVADRGRGIPAAKQRIVFDRYQQVDASDSRRQGGTGLGLAICRDIVSLHGGRIWVTSELGVGSEFRFSLPLARPDRPAEPPSTGPATDRRPAAAPAEPGQVPPTSDRVRTS